MGAAAARPGDPGHISSAFDVEIRGIRESIVRMGDLALGQARALLEAMEGPDLGLAERIEADDSKVDALELLIGEQCTEVLVRRSPTAGDLRFVLAAIRFAGDCERVGDEAARVAAHLRRVPSPDALRAHQPRLRDLGGRAVALLERALEGFREIDRAPADRVFRMEREFAELCRAHEEELGAAPAPAAGAVRARLFAFDALRALERIAGHAGNMAEQVAYVVDGVDLRHYGAADGAADGAPGAREAG